MLLVLSAFFSGTETALMSINRYRLRHRAREGHRGAQLAEKLLEKPERLIGLILLGNNAVNIFASALVTIIALQMGGEGAVAAGAFLLTLVILIFAEVAPKTMAARHPEKLALPAAFIYYPLLKITYPLVWLVNLFAGFVLMLLGATRESVGHALSQEELRTVVIEAGARLPARSRRMMMSVLDLQNVTVDDIMVPRPEVVAIDLDDDWSDVLELIEESQHTRLPVINSELDDIVGMLHLRDVLPDLAAGELDRERLIERVREAYFVPENTPLATQLMNFQRTKRRSAMVVDEYGDIQGLVTLDDILEEIVGEFTSDPASAFRDVQAETNGSYVVNGGANIRSLNRLMNWHLPTDGPKTLNGLILEHLEAIPAPGDQVDLHGHLVEILQIADNGVKAARMWTPPEGADTPA
jgi:Mg2+/Co2+ transporter CorB